MTHNLIDVLICSYNEAEHIPKLLDSLRAQSVSSDVFRVVFVDNASTDNTREVVTGNQEGINLMYVYEPRFGKSFAANTGFNYIEANYIAYIDADCKADRDWIMNIISIIEQKSPDVIGGPFFPYYISNKPNWYMDSYNTFQLCDYQKYLDENYYLCGANMIWKRCIIKNMKGFKLSVGLMGGKIVGGEDTNLLVRARKMYPDLNVYYDPSIIVYHLTKPEKMSLSYSIKWSYNHGRSSLQIWETKPLGVIKAICALIMNSIYLITKLFRSFFRDKTLYPYPENYLMKNVSENFSRIGMSIESIKQKLVKSNLQN